MLGHDERVAVAGVESHGGVSGELEVLALVVADGDDVGVVQQDVGRLQRRVGEQCGRNEAARPVGLVLELRHAAQLAEGDRGLHQPAQLGVFGNLGLDEQRGDVGVDADGQEDLGDVEGARAGSRPAPSGRVSAWRSTMQ